jgi:hypothetical protein
MTPMRPEKQLLDRWVDLAPVVALVVVVPAVLLALTNSAGHVPNPDSYYHAGAARLYAEQGWLSSFPWLEHTALGAHFPNLYLLQHLLLAPLAYWDSPDDVMSHAAVLLATVLVLSIALVLRRWGVRGAWLFAALGVFASPLTLQYACFLKGGSTFFVLLIWYVDGVYRGSVRQTFALAWLSVYAYVGAPLLIPIALVFLVVGRLWSGHWRPQILVATLGGLAAGLIINPFWPDHWAHIGRELYSLVQQDSDLVANVLRGHEWRSLRGKSVLLFAIPHWVAWFVLLLRQAFSTERVSAQTAAGVAISLGLFAGGLLAGEKILYLSVLLSVLFIPALAKESGPWPKLVVALFICAALGASGEAVYENSRESHSRSRPPASEFRVMAEFVQANSDPGEMVVLPWDDFPGFFHFNTHNHYPVGLNLEFLRRTSPTRFDAFRRIYEGNAKRPERLLPTFFDDARYIIARAQPRHRGEIALLKRMDANEHFTELVSPSSVWRIFRLENRPLRGDPSAAQAELELGEDSQ